MRLSKYSYRHYLIARFRIFFYRLKDSILCVENVLALCSNVNENINSLIELNTRNVTKTVLTIHLVMPEKRRLYS